MICWYRKLLDVTILFDSIILDKKSEDHVIKVFSKLMLEGNVRAAVRLVTEQVGGGVLDPDATIPSGQNSSIFVRDVLLHKHLGPCVPPASVLPCCDALAPSF